MLVDIVLLKYRFVQLFCSNYEWLFSVLWADLNAFCPSLFWAINFNMKSNVLWPYSSVENSLNLQGCEESLENVCQSFKVVNKFTMFSCKKKFDFPFTQQHMSNKKRNALRCKVGNFWSCQPLKWMQLRSCGIF